MAKRGRRSPDRRVDGKAYVVTNLANGKRYVGITGRSVATRFRQHLRDAASGARSALHAAIRKHGAASFAVEEVGRAATWRALCALERRLIRRLGTFVGGGRGYNLTLGGDGMPGFAMPEAFRAAQAERMRQRQRARMADPEVKAACAAQLERIRSDPELNERMRRRQAEGMRRGDVRQGVRERMTALMADAGQRVRVAEQTAAAMASAEVRRRMSEAKAALYADPGARRAASERRLALAEDVARAAKARAARRAVLVDGVRHASCEAAGRALGVSGTTVRARVERGHPGYAYAEDGARTPVHHVVAAGRRFATANAAARALGLSVGAVRNRVARGWPGYHAVGADGRRLPPAKRRTPPRGSTRGVLAAGVEHGSLKAAARSLGLSPSALANRIRKGWPGYAYVPRPAEARA